MNLLAILKTTNTYAAKPESIIPPRDKKATDKMVDLSKYYNSGLDDNLHKKYENTLTSLPKCTQNFGGTFFDIRGIIQLAGSKSFEKTGLAYPNFVKGIKVNSYGKMVHFLHASAWDIKAPECQIGEYIVNFDHDKKEKIILTYKKNIWNWWGDNENNDSNPIWTGENERVHRIGCCLRLFKYSWKNPYQALNILSIDFISALQGPAPFLVAITLD